MAISDIDKWPEPSWRTLELYVIWIGDPSGFSFQVENEIRFLIEEKIRRAVGLRFKSVSWLNTYVNKWDGPLVDWPTSSKEMKNMLTAVLDKYAFVAGIFPDLARTEIDKMILNPFNKTQRKMYHAFEPIYDDKDQLIRIGEYFEGKAYKLVEDRIKAREEDKEWDYYLSKLMNKRKL